MTKSQLAKPITSRTATNTVKITGKSIPSQPRRMTPRTTTTTARTSTNTGSLDLIANSYFDNAG